jgi:hypothetical protein
MIVFRVFDTYCIRLPGLFSSQRLYINKPLSMTLHQLFTAVVGFGVTFPLGSRGAYHSYCSCKKIEIRISIYIIFKTLIKKKVESSQQ